VNKIDRAYKSIGEFVITFQWVENKYREIGWFILDPERRNWPPMELRKENNHDLIEKVTVLFLGLTEKYTFPNGPERAADFDELRHEFHEFRRFRNRLLHSSFIELKAGGELFGFLRSNPKIRVDGETGELIYDQERFDEEFVHTKLKEVSDACFRLSNHYVQLIHWCPFDRFPMQA